MKNLTRDMPSHTRDRDKWLRLKELPQQDSTQPHVRHVAEQFWAIALLAPRERRVVCFAQLVLALARDCIQFESDTKRTGGEDIAGFTRPYTDPLEPLTRGADDCDAKARLFVALCLSHRLPARMVPWWDPVSGDLQHVSAELLIGSEWRPAETILARARLGESFHTVPVEPNGVWKYA